MLQQISVEDVKDFITDITPNKDWLYIFQPCSVGDFMYSGGLSLAVQERKNKSATVLIVKERMKNLGITYENFADIMYLDESTMKIVMQYFYVTGDYEGDNYIYGHFHKPKEGGEYIWDTSLHLIDRYKDSVFNIPLDTPYLKPVVPKLSDENIAKLHAKYIIDKNRTIILTPYTYSSKQLDMRFWMFLAMILTEKGYVCYTSVNPTAEREKPIPGTEAMTINFCELHYLAEKVKCFIGSRVGIFDFLAFTGARTLNINPFPKWLWDSSIMYPDCNNKTFYNAMGYLAPIVKTFQKDGVNFQFKLSHEHIHDEDICYSYEDILNGILAEVEKI